MSAGGARSSKGADRSTDGRPRLRVCDLVTGSGAARSGNSNRPQEGDSAPSRARIHSDRSHGPIDRAIEPTTDQTASAAGPGVVTTVVRG